MRSYFRHIPRLICLVLALAACQDDSTAPIRTETEPILDESISGEMGTGYLVGRSGLPFAIRFVVSNGRAIWLGHVDIGPADRIPRTLAEFWSDRPHGAVIDGYRWNRVDDYGYVTVPYVIDASLPDTSRVTAAIAHVEARTDGILFVPRTNQTDYVRFLPWDTQLCQGSYGRQGGQQTVMLHSSCHVGRVIHELGHVLNMFHEHQRCDRDQYVEALFQGSAYDRVCDGASDLFDYNESSIMHYDDTINGVARFLSLRGRASEMGQRDSLATTDVWTINQMYPYLFAVSVGGPYLITEPGDYTWNAVAIGGNGTYTNYTWEIALDDAQTVWYAAGTGQSHTRTLSGPGVDRFYLRVRVSSDGRTTTSVPYAVTNAME